MQELILKIILLPSIFITIYLLAREIKDKQLRDRIAKKVEEYNIQFEKRTLKLRYKQYYVSRKKSGSRIQKRDILISKSNIRRYISFFTVEVLTGISIIMAVIAFVVTFKLLYNIFAGILAAGAAFFFLEFLLKMFAYKNSETIDNQLIYYINIISNFLAIKDELVYAIEKAAPYLREPFRTFSVDFVGEVKHGYSINDSLENLKNKVDNRKFKSFIKNLQICAKYKGSYKTVVLKSMNLIKRYSAERQRRRSQARSNRLTIYTMMAINVWMYFQAINMNSNGDYAFKSTLVGQLIIAYNLFALLYALYKSFTLERFEY